MQVGLDAAIDAVVNSPRLVLLLDGLDEIADVAICLLMLVDRTEVDLPAAVHDKLRRIRVKYPPGTV